MNKELNELKISFNNLIESAVRLNELYEKKCKSELDLREENKDLKSSNIYLSKTCDKYKMELERLNNIINNDDVYGYIKHLEDLTTKKDNIINELKKYIEDTKQDGYKLVWINEYKNYFEAGIEEILGSDKE